jgi:hypothetical protein
LFRRAILGILNLLILGKPAERRGRKATGLKRGAMTAGLPAGRKLIVEKPWPRGREEREQGEQQRPQEARGVVPVGGLKGFCLALGKRVIRACGARVARSERLCLALGRRVIQACGARSEGCLPLGRRVIQACVARVARSQAAKVRQTPSGWYCTRERTA